MKKLLIIGFFCILCVFAVNSSVLADGKFYAREKVPPDLPYQRAIISYQDGEELMILQSKFDGDGKDFGWVIPLPNPPKIGSIKEGSEERFFNWLANVTEPNHTSYYTIILLFFPFALLLLIAARIYYAIKKKPVPVFWQIKVGTPDTSKKSPPPFLSTKVRPAITLIIILFFVVIIASIATPNLLSSRKGVDVLREEKIGVYDIKVIKASDANELIKWLNDHQYKFTPEDELTFKAYIKQNWCFVTARIRLENVNETWFGVRENLPNPLVFTFNTKQIIYPLALTATAAKETEILLYVFGMRKMATDTRFEMEFADKVTMPEMEISIESPDNINMSRFPHSYLTKLRGKLSADQMKEDLIIKPATDDEPYRKHIWRW